MKHTLLRVIHEDRRLSRDFRRDWNRLHQKTPKANCFTSLEWIEPGIRLFTSRDDSIHPLRFVNAVGETVAMAIHGKIKEPGRFGKIKCWRTLDFNAQRITPVLAPDGERATDALLALYEEVAPTVDRFDFFKLDGLDGDIQHLCNALRARGLDLSLNPFNEQPRILIPSPAPEGFQFRGATTRKRFRRLERKMEKDLGLGDVRYQRICRPDEMTEDIWAAVKSLFLNSWQAQAIEESPGTTAATSWEFYESTARLFCEQGKLDLSLLYAGDQLQAYDLNIRDDQTVYMINGCYDEAASPYSPGSILLHAALRDSLERGDRIIEMGGDHLEYKGQWTQDKETAFHLRIAGGTPRAKFKTKLRRLRS